MIFEILYLYGRNDGQDIGAVIVKYTAELNQ
jgi:hypothetical protein